VGVAFYIECDEHDETICAHKSAATRVAIAAATVRFLERSSTGGLPVKAEAISRRRADEGPVADAAGER
jgi:hypothetical protein